MSHTGWNKERIEQVVRTYSDPLTRYAFCYVQDAALAEDIMEEAIATLLLQRKDFRDENHLQGYLYRVTKNKAIDQIRKQKREVPLEDVQDVLQGSDVENQVMRDVLKTQIYTCMQKLPQKYREVLYLSYFEDFSVDQVCSLIKKNKKQVYNLLSRSKQTLREIFLKEGITYEDLF